MRTTKLIIFVILCMCIPACSPGQMLESTITPSPTITFTVAPSSTFTQTNTPTITLTPTPEPTDTPLPTDTPTPTLTSTPTPQLIDDGRRWTYDQWLEFWAFVYSWLMSDPSYVNTDPYIPSLPNPISEMTDDEVLAWMSMAHGLDLPAAHWCAVGYAGYINGYGWKEDKYTEEERYGGLLERLQARFGNPQQEPYCSEFAK